MVVEGKDGKTTSKVFKPKDPLVVEDLPENERGPFKNPKKVTIVPQKPKDDEKGYTVKTKINICEKPITTTPSEAAPPESTPAAPTIPTPATPLETTPSVAPGVTTPTKG